MNKSKRNKAEGWTREEINMEHLEAKGVAETK